MSKPVPKPEAKAPDIKATSKTFYRIHRIDAFSWQAYKLTGSTEAPVFKPDLLEIVMRKIGTEMKQEGSAEFLAAKSK